MNDEFETYLVKWRGALRRSLKHGYFNNHNEIETLTDVLTTYRSMKRKEAAARRKSP